MNSLAKKTGSKFAMAFFPDLHTLDGYPFRSIHNLVGGFAQSRGVPFIDLGIKYTNLGSIIQEKQTIRKEKWKGTRNPRMLEVSKKIMVRNSYGFVGLEFPVRKPPGVYRIVAMGGSTTAGFIDGATPWNPFTTLLEELFRRNARGLSWIGKVEVLNAGVNGMKMEGIYNRLKDRVLALNPDLVILKPGWPDLVNIASAAMGTDQVSANRPILSLTRVSPLVVGMRSLAGNFFAWRHGVVLDPRGPGQDGTVDSAASDIFQLSGGPGEIDSAAAK